MTTTNTLTLRRFRPIQIGIHWFSAVTVLVAMSSGTLVLKALPNTAEKIVPLQAHIGLGLVAAAAILVGVLFRLTLPQPPRMGTGSRRLDFLAIIVHKGLRMAVLGMVGSGVALAIQAGLPAILLSGGSVPLPHDFWIYGPRLAHAVFAKVIMGMIGLHVAGALFHQFVKKDGLLGRMWFGNSSTEDIALNQE